MAQQRLNAAERRFEARAESNGWFVTKRGWPDFICELPDGKVIVVEVKPTTAAGVPTRVKLSQAKVMEWLTEHGIRCFVSDGYVLEAFDPKRHRERKRRADPTPANKLTPFTWMA